MRICAEVEQDEERKLAGSRWQETGFVFATRIGTPPDARGLLRDYYAITRPKSKDPETPAPRRPFPPIRFHDLRHSAATLLLAQGVSPKYLAELLGHSQVSFTMQTHAHVLPEVKRETAAKMNGILDPSCYQRCYQEGRREGELNRKLLISWCARTDSNCRPSGS